MASWQARAARHFIRKRIRPAFGDMRDLMRVRQVMGQAMPPPKGVTTRATPSAASPANGSSAKAPPASRPARARR